jgi:hypothetical protein
MKHSAITRRVSRRLWIRISFEVVHLAFVQEALRKASQRRPGSSSIGLQAFQEQSPPSWFAIQEGSLRSSAGPGRGCVVLDRPARRVRAGSLSAMTAELQVRTLRSARIRIRRETQSPQTDMSESKTSTSGRIRMLLSATIGIYTTSTPIGIRRETQSLSSISVRHLRGPAHHRSASLRARSRLTKDVDIGSFDQPRSGEI